MKTMLWILLPYPNWKVRLYFSWESVLLTIFAVVCVQAGKSTDTPAAILEQGTTAHQRRIVAD